LLLVGLAPALLVSKARAADPQPYQVVIESTGSSAMDDVLRSSSLLVTLKDEFPVPPFGLIIRATGDIQRWTTALNSFGYYAPRISIMIAGRDVGDQSLPSLLEQTPQGKAVNVNVAIDEGPLYRLRRIGIEGTIPRAAEQELRLSPGDAAIAADVMAARARVLTALQEDGYALATVSDPIALADDEAHVLDVTFTVDGGPQVEVGPIIFRGLEQVNESFARKSLPLQIGERYSPSKIEAARRALVETGVFIGVTARAADQASSDGRIAVTFEVQERPLHAVNLAGTYSTDLGIDLSASWTHRNLFGNAERLTLSAAGTGLWGNATDDVGYQVSAQFVKPLFLRRDLAWEVDLSAVKQDLRAYKQRAESAGAFLRRKFLPEWTASLGVTAAQDDVSQKGTSRIYQLLALPITAAYDSTQLASPLLDPTHGLRASFAVTPTQAFGARNLTFGIVQASAATYFDFSEAGRSVLALRGIVGVVLGASNFDLPPDQRLYAGGSGTVRGFRYQSIGPLFADGDPIGGTAADAASIEFRQHLFGNFGGAAFIDAGQASDEGVPFTGTLRMGAGAGLRYQTPIGAVRADFAVPLNPAPRGDAFELYIGLGQAF
jgi:translocation and assembly module TamA